MTNGGSLSGRGALLHSIALAGYRSFGKEPQYLSSMAKLTLLIGRNNSGKSNVIRFLRNVAPGVFSGQRVTLTELDAHLPDRPATIIGWQEELTDGKEAPKLRSDHELLNFRGQYGSDLRSREYLQRVLNEFRRLGQEETAWTFQDVQSGNPDLDRWGAALRALPDSEMSFLWQALTERSQGGRKQHWEPEILQLIKAPTINLNVTLIPAIRHIRARDQGSGPNHDGGGLVEDLARLQNPDLNDQADRARFEAITSFVRNVTNTDDATLDIPHNRSTILVKMDGQTLPIESLGTGIHEVIILAATATTLSRHLVCIEEPELHLNPLLQRKLMRYLTVETDNQNVISTHSPAIMDTPHAEIYHIELINRASRIVRATSSRQRSLICEDLGYHPSDLLQANCIIWVEGPSDRLYLKWWISSERAELIEGIHYSIMFYGGRLAAHLSADDVDSVALTDFINLRSLNPRGVILIDSDRRKKFSKLNPTKRRLQREFDSGPGHAWITAGREIENYVARGTIEAAVSEVHPSASCVGNGKPYDGILEACVRNTGRAFHVNKVEIARRVISTSRVDLNVLDLAKRVRAILTFIDQSNPG